MAGSFAKGCISGSIEQQSYPKTKYNQDANFHPFVDIEYVNWLDRTAVRPAV